MYFHFSRGLLVENMDRTHLEARKHLLEARKYAEWSEKDRQSRLPPLTAEQREQLQAYLDLVAEKQYGEQRRIRPQSRLVEGTRN